MTFICIKTAHLEQSGPILKTLNFSLCLSEWICHSSQSESKGEGRIQSFVLFDIEG